MLVIPAPVKSDGRLPTMKFGGAGAPLTLAVNCVMRSRTRSDVTVIGGPGFAGEVRRISNTCPGNSCDVSVAPWNAVTSPLGGFSSSICTWEVGLLLRVITTGFPTLTLLRECSSSRTTISKCVASSILNTTPSISSSSALSSNEISLARKMPPGIIIASTSTTMLLARQEKLFAAQLSNSNRVLASVVIEKSPFMVCSVKVILVVSRFCTVPFNSFTSSNSPSISLANCLTVTAPDWLKSTPIAALKMVFTSKSSWIPMAVCSLSSPIIPEVPWVPWMTSPGDGKFTMEVSVPVGLISHTAPGAHPARVMVVPFLKVSSGFAKVRFKLVYVPGDTPAVFKNADSVSSSSTSMRTGPRPASKSTPPGLSVAPVTLTSNESTVTPVGGVSVTVTDNADAPGRSGFVMEPLQLKIKKTQAHKRISTGKTDLFIRHTPEDESFWVVTTLSIPWQALEEAM